MDPVAVLAAFDEQIRRRGERVGGVIRVRTDDGWAGVTSSDLDEHNANAAIDEQIGWFAELGKEWEWKHYSYDKPADLPARLLAAGFTPEPTEALMVAEIAELATDVTLPSGVELITVTDERTANMFARVHDDVFGGDYSEVGRNLLVQGEDQ
ncbi:MAG TPA: hypothetical protein VNO21_08285, partial [Polyangiaceae bacterium]|nr:hypothetical protein [Polyangiaceae bacterium]